MSRALDRVASALKALDRAQAALSAERANRRILCACGKMHPIRLYDLIVTHWYVEPYSCSGGDYWNEGEWNIVCPNGVNNRLMFNDYDVQFDKRDTIGVAAEPTFKRLYPRELWKSVSEEYERYNKRTNNLNRYVDAHRKRFELPEHKK